MGRSCLPPEKTENQTRLWLQAWVQTPLVCSMRHNCYYPEMSANNWHLFIYLDIHTIKVLIE